MPRELDCCAPLEYPVEVALGTVDFLMEDVDGGDSTILAYYRLLNCGFRPGLVAATDFPCNRREPIGSLLTYVSIPGGNLSYRGWIAGVAAGRTVVSRHAHREFLDLKVNGAVSPGDEVQLAAAGPVKVDVRWLAAEKLDGRLELVRNGAVVASQKTSAAPGAPGALALELEFRKSGWIAARRMDAHGHQLQTGAVFVTVKGRPVRANADDAGYFVHFIDHLLAQTASARSWGVYLPHDRDAARQRYRQAREIYRRIAREAHKEAQP